MSFVLRHGGREELGGKASALSRLENAGLPVPPWFAISPASFFSSLTAEQADAVSDADAVRRESALRSLSPSDAVRSSIRAALDELGCNGSRYAVRSSAIDEDGRQHSFAGQMASFLFVDAPSVAQKAAQVWRSGFSARVLEYRTRCGLPPLPPQPPAVIVQKMVQATVSGVAFSADPVTGRRAVAVVSALPGMGTALVGGEAADVFKVDRSGIVIERTIARKTTRHSFDPVADEGVSAVKVRDADAERPSLTDEQVARVAALAREAACIFGEAQDIEWAMEDDQLFLLQSRPITTMRNLCDPDGALNIWDNSNITESYNGVTTPLTFSFARHVYEGVYRQFCRMLRVPRKRIAANDRMFRGMLGLIRGRVYYNLLNWYRALALLPGFTLNHRFMEQMMGVREGLPDEIACQLSNAGARDKFIDSFRTLCMIFGLAQNYLTLDRQVRRFRERLETALAAPGVPFKEMRLDELVAHYYRLDAQLLLHWDAPLTNDFFAMIFHGLLRKLTARWCGDADGALANDAIRGQKNLISVEPAARVREMAEIAAAVPELSTALREAPLEQAIRMVRTYPDFAARYDAYLTMFGDRCMEELKLESKTLHDDPLPLLRSIGAAAKSAPFSRGSRVETSANVHRKIDDALPDSRLRRAFLLWVLRQARERVRHRENLRFARTRLFGTVRRLFLEIGRRLHAIGRIDEPNDIFYFEVEEILRFTDGAATTTDLSSLIAIRRKEFEQYRQGPVPAQRFETRGAVYDGQTFRSTREPEGRASDSEERRGLGCCRGLVSGTVRIVRDPRDARLTSDSILVADHTDPGWVMLFPSARGLLVERGSLLSHSAIVARELGIPAVIAIPGLLDWLRDGDQVELDGGAGLVRRLSVRSAHAQ